MSEEKISKFFLSLLINNDVDKRIPSFDKIIPEFEAYQGVPDYVGLKGKKISSDLKLKILNVKKVWGKSGLLVISSLSNKKSHSKHYISKKTGIPLIKLEKILTDLHNSQIIQILTSGNYRIELDLDFNNVEIWAFEIKINDWKRALFQAVQAKAYSSYSYVIFPNWKEDILKKNKDLFKKNGIGIILFDENVKSCKILSQPKKNRYHHNYFLDAYISI